MAAPYCENPTEFRTKHGFGENFIKSVRKNITDIDLNKKRLNSLAKNLGLDDARAVKLKDGKKSFFGRNLKEIENFDPEKTGNVPKDTIVSMPRQDGTMEYFISKRSTNQAPQRWVVDMDGKQVKPHPDWAKLGQNQTVTKTGELKRFSRTKNGNYVEDKNGEYFLNIQNPYRGGKKPKYELANEGYDAYYKDGMYKPFHEGTQVIDRKGVFISPDDQATAQSKRTTKVNPQDVSEEEITDALQQDLGLGRKAAASLAGYVSGKLIESHTDMESAPYIGGALGLALGTRRVRNYVRGINGYGKSVEGMASSLEDAQKNYARTSDDVNTGYRGDINDEQAKNDYRQQVKNEYKKLKDRGERVWSFLVDNPYFKSSYSRLKAIGTQTADVITKALQRTQSAHIPIREKHAQVISRNFGNISLNDYRQRQAQVIRDYINSAGLTKYGEQATEAQLLDDFGASVKRIVTHDAKLDDAGRLTWDTESVAANNVYKDEVKKQIDRHILSSEEGRRILETERQAYDEMGQMMIDTFDRAINKLEQTMPDDMARMFRNYRESNLSFNQWYKNSERLGLTYDKYVDNEILKEALDYSEKQLKVKSLKGRYIPQTLDSGKLTRAKQDFFRRNNLENSNMSPEQKEEAWAQHLTDRIIEANTDGYKAKELSFGGDDIETIYHSKFKDAYRKMRDHYVNRITDDEIRAQVARDMANEDPAVMDEYFPKVMKGDKEYYYISNPSHLVDENGNQYDLVRDINKETIGDAQQTFLNMVTYKQSNFLDNPRNFILPTELQTNDLDELLNRYSRDVGLRKHLIDNDMGTNSALERQITKVKNELQDKGVDPLDIQEDLDKIRTNYAHFSKTSDFVEIDMTASDRLKRWKKQQKNSKLIDSLLNFGYAPFLWFTPFYSIFTPNILGGYLAGQRNILKAQKMVFKDPKVLKYASDEMEKYGAYRKIARDFSPELSAKYSSDGLSGSDNSVTDSIFKVSQRFVDISAKTSPVKTLLSHPKIKTDLEDTGLLRLFAGDMLSISGAESALVTLGVFREVQALSEAAEYMMKKPDELKGTVKASQIDEYLEKSGQDVPMGVPEKGARIRMNGHTYTWEGVNRQLERFGIDNPTRFLEENRRSSLVNNKRQIDNYMDKITTGKELPDDMSDYLREEYSRLMNTVVDQYHGRSRMSRPIKWTDNVYGKLLSQFSSYAQNFGHQTVKARMYDPLKKWYDTYGKGNNESLFKMAYHMKTGNDKALQRIFGDQWEQAYNDFPVDAVDTIFKVTPVALGVGTVMNATRDTVMDFINMMGNEAIGNDDYQAWKNTKENYGRMNEIFGDDKVGFDIAKATYSTINTAIGMGYTSRYGQLLLNESRYQRGGLFSKTPVTGMANDLYSDVLGETMQQDGIVSGGKTFVEQTARFATGKMPIIGTFNQARQGMMDIVFKKPKNRDVNFYDAETGVEFDELHYPMD